MHNDVATQVLWDHEREEILAVLGVDEIDPRAWSTKALVERIRGSIEPLGSDLLGEGLALGHGAHQAFDVTLAEIEDWLDGVPLFDASTPDQNALQKLDGPLTVTQTLWDHERREILRVLGIEGDSVHLRSWSTEKLVNEIKDCIEGRKVLAGEAHWLAGRPVEKIVELDADDPELLRAWRSFPNPVADKHSQSWEYLATELIEGHWVHLFVNGSSCARVPARSEWGP
jgi:hypothetical protein